MNLIEEINKALREAARQNNNIYNKLSLGEMFDNWFKDLDRTTKVEIYKMYQLNQLSFDE